ncbi:Hypothetical protein SMAX5B_014105 [Scophthalmus maximus]|uniref:Uncharacterized protein n=1 Tax=Scophthalmus maximus TaxID=52904 RepID=A0A2U9BHM4_SCOMX|nr:Hypothetical protein SMAX5B_014105 [Scophthalmus maximus]
MEPECLNSRPGIFPSCQRGGPNTRAPCLGVQCASVQAAVGRTYAPLRSITRRTPHDERLLRPTQAHTQPGPGGTGARRESDGEGAQVRAAAQDPGVTFTSLSVLGQMTPPVEFQDWGLGLRSEPGGC